MPLATPIGLLTEDQVDPLKLTVFDPVFSWADYPSGQRAFRIQVSTDPSFVVDSVVFDTSKVELTQTQLNYKTELYYKWGEAGLVWDDPRIIHWQDRRIRDDLVRGIRYYWRLVLWDSSDLITDWSATAEFQINQLPVVQILSASATGGVDGNVDISFSVNDDDSDLCRVNRLQYLIDGIWYTSSALFGNTTGLNNATHLMDWHSETDLPDTSGRIDFRISITDEYEESLYSTSVVVLLNAGPEVLTPYISDPINEFVNLETLTVRVGSFMRHNARDLDNDLIEISSIYYELSINDAAFGVKWEYLDSNAFSSATLVSKYHDFEFQTAPVLSMNDILYYRITATDANGVQTVISKQTQAIVEQESGYNRTYRHTRIILTSLEGGIYETDTITPYNRLKIL